MNKSYFENNKIPPCQNACPIGQDVRGYIYLIAQNRLNDAAKLIRETNPLPAICGSICAHPCEDECRRGSVDQPLSIRRLKRYVMETAPVPYPEVQTKPANGMKIAIIGSGPAGLTAAHDLAIEGYEVSIYDNADDFGGSIRWGVPSYRLPLETIRKDLDAIERLGVKFYKNKALGKDFTIQSLKEEGCNAIILSMGLSESRKLNIPNSDHKNVMTALPFLRSARKGDTPVDETDETVVIGSGDVAMDVCRSAVRLGAKKVRLACLEQWEQMPASDLEKDEALEEGIEMEYTGWGPKSITLDNDGHIKGLEVKECVQVFDNQGRFNPQFNEEHTSIVKGNKVIFAIGQHTPLEYLEDMGVELDDRGRLSLDRKGMTSVNGVFSSGEVTKGPGLAVEAMANARKIARNVHEYLIDEEHPSYLNDHEDVIEPLADRTLENIKNHMRQQPKVEPVESRVDDFREVEKLLSSEEAIQETKRCLNCGRGAHWNFEQCAFCLNCVRVCPYEVPQIAEDQTIEIPQDQCQACGLCYSLCPANAIDFRMDDVTRFEEKISEEAQFIRKQSGMKQLNIYCYYSQTEIMQYKDKLEETVDHSSFIGIPCMGKLKTKDVYMALGQGYDRVRFYACDEEDCTHPESSTRGLNKVERIRQVLINMGYSEDKLQFMYLTDLKSQLNTNKQ